MTLKQIFCKHIWKTEEEEELGEYIRYIGGIFPKYYVKEYAIKHKCIKCEKKNIEVEEIQRMLTPEEILKFNKYAPRG